MIQYIMTEISMDAGLYRQNRLTGWYSGKNNKICTVPGHSSTGTSVNIPFIPNMYFCFDPDRGGFVVSIGCVS